MAGDQRGDRLALDRRRLLVAEVGERLEQLGAQTERGEPGPIVRLIDVRLVEGRLRPTRSSGRGAMCPPGRTWVAGIGRSCRSSAVLSRGDGPTVRTRRADRVRVPWKSGGMLWGTETSKAVENFHISGEPIPARVVHWLGRIKSAAAGVNADLDLLDGDLAADDRRRGRRDRGRGTRRRVPDRRVPDGLRHVVEHERQRGHQLAHRRPGPPERPRQPRSELERRVPVRGPSRRVAGGSRRSGAGARSRSPKRSDRRRSSSPTS